MIPEFSRPLRLDAIGEGEQAIEIAADPAECVALAARFGLIVIDSLTGQFVVRREAAGIIARGRVSAVLTQACAVTDEPLPAAVEEDAAIRFLPADSAAGEETELDEADCDTMFYEGGAIDLGEAAAETMALALDPYRRGPNAEAALRAAGVLSEEEAGPFGALAALKGKLARS
jgi:uncharacterized metal-binding protein YceD (DUF177 family)